MTTDPKKPNHVVDLEKTASQLAKHIDLTESEIYGILKTGKEKEKFQVEFGAAGKDISFETKGKIEKLKLPGITFTREYETILSKWYFCFTCYRIYRKRAR